MPRWEYRKIDLGNVPPRTDEISLLNAAGHERWELVAITSNNFAYLKRPLDNVVPTAKPRGTQPATKPAP